MKMQVIAVRDIKANVYGVPMYVPNIPAAIRNFADQVNTPGENNILNKHPEDFEIWHLGEYDDETAIFKPEDTRRRLALAADFIRTNH